MTHSSASLATSPTLDALLSQSLHAVERSAACCCGQEQCAYLESNNAAMQGLEKNLQSAAQVGQALLNRHEAYMAEAEEERRKMEASIGKLESEKKALEAENERTIEENRYLLDQLENINNGVIDSDAQILSLNNTLDSTRREMERLTGLAAQAQHLEAQMAIFEKDQEDLQRQLIHKREEERTAVQRWKGAERTIGTLQEQVDRIEREASEERARHAEVVARLERRRVVERELESAAGRLKGAAAATTLEKNSGGTVVLHFVKDILQDNANLQLGIVELREMLMGSNEEVENLREQMMLHQPVQSRPDGLQRGESLNNELAKTPINDASPDLHVHHHYHAAPKVEAKKKAHIVKRPRKPRHSISSGFRTPSSGASTPRTLPSSPYLRASTPSAAATILAQTSVTIPPPEGSHMRQWSMQSSQPSSSMAASSLPSSPHSAFRSLSVFDTIDDGQDSSRPTTPGSTFYGSPTIGPRQWKRNSDISVQSLNAPAAATTHRSISSMLHDAETKVNHTSEDIGAFPLLEQDTILEEPEEPSSTRPSPNVSALQDYVEDHFTSAQLLRPRLHRANSHESILSTHDPSIPKLRSQRSQLLTTQGFTPCTPLRTTSTSASIGPVTSSTSAVIQPSAKQPRGYNSSDYNRLLLSNNNTLDTIASSESEKSTISKRVGGWMFGKWGKMPTPATNTGNLGAKEILSAVEQRAREGRNDGKRVQTRVEPARVDGSLLKETLGESLDGRSFGI